MELEHAILSRRSIRRYINKEVSETQINTIIDCARYCQSAKNRQPCRFMILRGDKKNKIAKLMDDYCDSNVLNKTDSYRNTALAIKEANVLILIFKAKDDGWNIGDTLSIGAAIQNMCLEATNLGLGCLWIRDTVCVEDEICSIMGAEKLNLQLMSSLAIGYANEKPGERPRKTLDEIIIRND